MAKVLYTTPIMEYPAAGGPQLSVETGVKALSRHAELHIVSRVSVDRIGGTEAQRFYEKYCTRFLYAPSAGKMSRNKYLHRLQRFWVKYADRDVKFILDYYDKHAIDLIWCERSEFSFDLIRKIKERRPDAKVVCDTCAVYSQFILRELPYAESPSRKQQVYREGKKKEQEERILVDVSDVTTAVSELDAQYYRSIAADPERVHIFSNVVDVEAYQQPVAPAPGFKKPCIFLAGTFYSPQCPMADAVRWMISQILPLVRRQIPDVHCYIVGKGSTEFLADIKDPGITITGKVPSVLPYLRHADVSVVPLRFESGTRFKILEAGACGIPVVSTTLGAEGLAVTHQKDIIIADVPEDFAGAIAGLISHPDLAQKLARNLKTLVNEKYSVSTLADEGRRILEYMLKC